MVWYGKVWYDAVWCGMVRYGMIWYGMVWYGVVWYVEVPYGMVYGMVCMISAGAYCGAPRLWKQQRLEWLVLLTQPQPASLVNSETQARESVHLQESARRSFLAHPAWTSCHAPTAAAEESRPSGHAQSAPGVPWSRHACSVGRTPNRAPRLSSDPRHHQQTKPDDASARESPACGQRERLT